MSAATILVVALAGELIALAVLVGTSLVQPILPGEARTRDRRGRSRRWQPVGCVFPPLKTCGGASDDPAAFSPAFLQAPADFHGANCSGGPKGCLGVLFPEQNQR